MSKILILGDVHGNLTFLQDVVKNAKRSFDIDYVIQVGDFGFYPHVFEAMKRLGAFTVPVYAIDGNHEKHKWVFKQKKVWNMWKEKNNLIFCPRGTTLTIDERLIAFVGGAMNVDRLQEGSIEHRTTNYLLDVEAREIIEDLNNKPIVDLMVTHSCPHSIGVGMEGDPYFIPMIYEYITERFGIGTGPINDCGEQVLKTLWDGLDNKPLNWVFGHFHSHLQTIIGDTNFWCVGSTDQSDSVHFCIPYIYNTETNMVTKIESERI